MSFLRIAIVLVILASVYVSFTVADSRFELEHADALTSHASLQPSPQQVKNAKKLGVKVTKEVMKGAVKGYKKPGLVKKVEKKADGTKVVKSKLKAKTTGKEKGADFGNLGEVKQSGKATLQPNVFDLDNIVTIQKIVCGINGLTMSIKGGTATDPKSLDKAWKPWNLADKKAAKGTVLIGGRKFNCRSDNKLHGIAARFLSAKWTAPGTLFVTTAPVADHDVHKEMSVGMTTSGPKDKKKGKASFFEEGAASVEHATTYANTMFLEMPHVSTHDHALSTFDEMKSNLADHMRAELDFDSHDAGIDQMHQELHQHMLNFDHHHALATKNNPDAMSFLETHSNVEAEAEIMHEMLLNARADIPEHGVDLGQEISFQNWNEMSFLETGASSESFAVSAGWTQTRRNAAESCQLLDRMVDAATNKKAKKFKMAQPVGKRLSMKQVTTDGFTIQWIKNIWKDTDKVSVRLYGGPRKGIRHIVWAKTVLNSEGQNRNGVQVKFAHDVNLFKLDKEARFHFTFKVEGAKATEKSLKSKKYRINEFAIENGGGAEVLGLAKDQFYAMGTTAMVTLQDKKKIGIVAKKCKLYSADHKRVKGTKFTINEKGCAVKFPDVIGEYYVKLKYGKGEARGSVRSPVFRVKNSGSDGLNPTKPLNIGSRESIKAEKKIAGAGARATPAKGKKFMFVETDAEVSLGAGTEDADSLTEQQKDLLMSKSEDELRADFESNMNRGSEALEEQMVSRVAALEKELQYEMLRQGGWLNDPEGGIKGESKESDSGIIEAKNELSMTTFGVKAALPNTVMKCGLPENMRAHVAPNPTTAPETKGLGSGVAMPQCGGGQKFAIQEFKVNKQDGIIIKASGHFIIRPYFYWKMDGELSFEKEFELANVPIAGLSASVGAAAIGVYLKIVLPIIFKVEGKMEFASGQTIKYPWTYNLVLNKAAVKNGKATGTGNGLALGTKEVTNGISFLEADIAASVQIGIRIALALGITVGSAIKLEASIGATFYLQFTVAFKTAGFTQQEGTAFLGTAPIKFGVATCGGKHKMHVDVSAGVKEIGLKLEATFEFWIFEFTAERTYYLGKSVEDALTYRAIAACFKPMTFMLMETDSTVNNNESMKTLPAVMGEAVTEDTQGALQVQRRLRRAINRSA